MKLLTFIICFLSFSCFVLNAQDMNEGFKYLEVGNVQSAEVFFEGILKDHPKNKTALVCYGRAIGLNGKQPKAKKLFSDLLIDYPGDIEVELNYAESMLWGSEFEEAEVYYGMLVKKYPENFAALLGMANTFSNLKKYNLAIEFIERALKVSPGNPNALVSKKYIHLGYATVLSTNQRYDDSEEYLLKNLEFFPDDRDTYLSLANLYLVVKKFDKAEHAYEKVATNYKDSVLALNGKSLIWHLKFKEKNALKVAKEAVRYSLTGNDTVMQNQAKERYVQALIWNKKFGDARKVIDSLVYLRHAPNWTLSLRATLNTYTSNFKKTLKDYNTILVNDSAAFDGNLGKANTLKALKNYKEAYLYAYKTLYFYKKQKDAQGFIDNLNLQFVPTIDAKVAYSFDNGDNESEMAEGKFTFPFSTKFSLHTNYTYKDTKNNTTENYAKAESLDGGFSYLFHPDVNLITNFGLKKVDGKQDSFDQFITDVSLDMTPLKLQNLTIGYKKNIESFNADLLNIHLIQNTAYLNNNFSTNFRFGWYTQLNYVWQSDNNSKNLLFTSVYYNVLSRPVVKTGVNFQYITFKEQVPEVYFSPAQYKSIEMFAEILKDQGGLTYWLNAASGYQYTDDEEKQWTYRLMGSLGSNVSPRLMVNLYGMKSNIATSSVLGFTYTEVGFKLKWKLVKRPIYFKKIKNKMISDGLITLRE